MAQDFTKEVEEQTQTMMNSLWAGFEKVVDPNKGECVRFNADDPWCLYHGGFVDTERFTLEQWESMFVSSKQADGSYLMNYNDFMKLSPYRFFGIIRPPLDPMTLREGWYTLEDWRAYCLYSILPSTTLTVEHFVKSEDVMVEKGLLVEGKILIDQQQKLELQRLLDTYPSPKRIREIQALKLYYQMIDTEAGRSQSVEFKSTFAQGARLGTKQSKDLKEVLVKSSQISAATSAVSQKETFSVKDLRKASIKRNLNS